MTDGGAAPSLDPKSSPALMDPGIIPMPPGRRGMGLKEFMHVAQAFFPPPLEGAHPSLTESQTQLGQFMRQFDVDVIEARGEQAAAEQRKRQREHE